jgi:DNA-binding beta-propeller fold protein YncE
MRGLLLASCAALIGCIMPLSAYAATNYKLVKTIDLPGDKGGHGDWTTYDPQTKLVWLSQSPDHNVVVIDTAKNSIAHVIEGIPNANGIAFAGEYAFIADNDSSDVIVVGRHDFKKVATLTAVGKGPDSINYLTKEKKIYVSSGSNDATLFGLAAPHKKEATYKLQPEPAKDGPDIAVYVASKDKIYQPVDTVVDVIDAPTGKISAVWDVGITSAAKAAAYDPKTNHLIVGTGEKLVMVIDADTGKLVAKVPVAGAVDATIVDPGTRRAFEGDKSGVVDIIDLDSNKVVDSLPSEKNTHTLTVNTDSHAIYVYRNESNKVDVFEPVM